MGFSQDKIIGFLGGGQLGKMLCQAASNLDLNIHVLDKSPDDCRVLSIYFL